MTDISKKRIYKQVDERIDDGLPQEYRHIRDSERNVLDKFYLADADLIGEGLSPREALKVIEIVSNRCFDHRKKLLRPLRLFLIGVLIRILSIWLIANQSIMINILYPVIRWSKK